MPKNISRTHAATWQQKLAADLSYKCIYVTLLITVVKTCDKSFYLRLKFLQLTSCTDFKRRNFLGLVLIFACNHHFTVVSYNCKLSINLAMEYKINYKSAAIFCHHGVRRVKICFALFI
jgi:hypothetical protein